MAAVLAASQRSSYHSKSAVMLPRTAIQRHISEGCRNSPGCWWLKDAAALAAPHNTHFVRSNSSFMSTLVRIAARQNPLIFRPALVRCAYAGAPDFYLAPRFAGHFHTRTTDQNSLAKKRPNEQADVGTEGFHRSKSTFHTIRRRSFLIMWQRTKKHHSRR